MKKTEAPLAIKALTIDAINKELYYAQNWLERINKLSPSRTLHQIRDLGHIETLKDHLDAAQNWILALKELRQHEGVQ